MMENLVQKEIIIKCGLEEISKAFFEDYVIVWHDPKINNEENQKYIAQLKKFCEVFPFKDWQNAKDFVEKAKASCHVITSGSNGELLVKEIFMNQNVENIYIFCGDKNTHSPWAKNYQKVLCIETTIQDLVFEIQESLLEWHQKKSSLRLNLPAFAPIFNDSDKSQMNHLHRYLKVIPNFKNRDQAKDDFLALSKRIYQDSKTMELILDFEQNYLNYDKEQILKWYTRESFLYKVTNNCLRIATSDSIQYCRLLVKDLERAIKEQYQTKSKKFNGLLYRGAYLSEKEWENLKNNLDKEVEMHGFLSVSKEKNIALNFMESDPSKKVLITIIVPKGPNEEEQGFAEVEEFSDFHGEREVLFNVRSRFTVLETEDLPYRHLVLLYGAQGFRKFVTEQEEMAIMEVSISNIEDILCANCQVKTLDFPEKLFFVSITKQTYYCKKCVDHDTGPFLCVSTAETVNSSMRKIKGCLLQNSSQNKIPFYGYKCCKCKGKKQKCYHVCTDCDKLWCGDCFETIKHCLKEGHSIVLENSPFSFWCEKMSQNELNHLKFQSDFKVENNHISQQAKMFLESHEYEKAIESYNLFIKDNKDDSEVAASYNNLGLVYQKQGKYEKALEFYLKSLEIEENHPAIAVSYNNIGSIYSDQGEHKKALEYYLKSLEIYKALYGENHAEVATSYNNLGGVYCHQEDYEKGLEYLLKGLDIYKSIYGENHPFVATSFHNIGSVYNNQGGYKEALKCYLKGLEIHKAIYGENHPDVAISYNNIGRLYYNQGRFQKALESYMKSLNIGKSVYGENHPSVAASYNNIARIYSDQGKYEKALENHFISLEISKALYGENHLDVAASYNNIGQIFHAQRESEIALEYLVKSLEIQKAIGIYNGKEVLECELKVLDIRKSLFGNYHLDVAISYDNLGEIYSKLGKLGKALKCYLTSLEIRKSIFGENHEEVAVSYCNIGRLYEKQGEHSEALECQLKGLEIRKSIFGENHKDIAHSYNNIARLYYSQREYKAALEFALECLNIEKVLYGEEHLNVAVCYESIGNIFHDQGEDEMALEYFSKCVEIRRVVLGDDHSQTIDVQKKILEIKSRED